MRRTKIGKPFDKNLLRARTLSAEETAHMHDETEWMPNGRKIEKNDHRKVLIL
jgi:hypothetical protein